MAIQLVQENGKYNINRKHFLLDTENEFTDLENSYECSMGDIAELVDGTTYYRHSSGYDGDLWELNESSGGTNKLPIVSGLDEGKALRVSSTGGWIAQDLPVELPYVSNEDNGKILGVNLGYWDKIDNIPNYGEESYETILNTTSFTTAEDNGYYKCDDVCSLASLIDGDVIRVTFDGDEYEVEAKVSRYGKAIGDNVNNFTNYPFYINTGTFPGNATLYTEEAGTYSIKIERKVITSSKEFSNAAFASIKYIKFMTTQLLGGTQITCNYSRDEVWGMFEDEAPVIASIDGVLCAQGMKYLYPGMIQFRVLDFTSESNTPVLKERIISVNEYNTPEFSYSENLYTLYEYNNYPS